MRSWSQLFLTKPADTNSDRNKKCKLVMKQAPVMCFYYTLIDVAWIWCYVWMTDCIATGKIEVSALSIKVHQLVLKRIWGQIQPLLSSSRVMQQESSYTSNEPEPYLLVYWSNFGLLITAVILVRHLNSLLFQCIQRCNSEGLTLLFAISW